MTEITLLCAKCGDNKPPSEFYPRPGVPRGRCSWCTACSRDYGRARYAKNGPSERARNSTKRAEGRRRVLEYLSSRACAVCGEPDPAVLDFHHRDPSAKEFNIMIAVNHGTPWSRLEAEIAKPDVLCANDHRRLHSRERNDFRNRAKAA